MIIAMSRPRILRSASSSRRARSRAVEADRPLLICPGGGMSCMMARASVVLPEPDSPTRPRTSPAFDRKIDVAQNLRRHRPVAGKGDRQLVDIEERRAGAAARRSVVLPSGVAAVISVSSGRGEIDQVDDQIDDQRQDRRIEHEAEHRIEVGIEHALHGILSGATPAEDDLDEHGAADQEAVEHADDGDDRRQRIAQRLAHDDVARQPAHLRVAAEVGLQHPLHRRLRHLQDRRRH